MKDTSTEKSEENQPLQIPSNLLKSIRHQNKDVFAQKCIFIAPGSHGF